MADDTRSPGRPTSLAAVPPPRRRGPAPRHLHAVQVIALVGLLPLAATAVGLASTSHRRLVARTGRRGRPRTYSGATILLLALLGRLWQLSAREVCAWLRCWPALATACGLPDGRVIHHAHLSRRVRALGPYPCGLLCLVLVEQALRVGLLRGRDVVLDSALLAAWTPGDVGAGWSRPLAKGRRVLGYKVHVLLDRHARLPLLFLLSPANRNDLPLAYPLRWFARLVLRLPLRAVRADGGYWGLRLYRFITLALGAHAIIPFNRKRQPLARVRHRVYWPLSYGARAIVERFFAAAKRYYGLDTAYATGRDAVLRQVALTLCATLVVGLAAHRCDAPALRLSPTRVLAHYLPIEEGL